MQRLVSVMMSFCWSFSNSSLLRRNNSLGTDIAPALVEYYEGELPRRGFGADRQEQLVNPMRERMIRRQADVLLLGQKDGFPRFGECARDIEKDVGKDP